MPEPRPKRRLPWWPMPVTRENETYSDEFYMSLASLAMTYFFFVFCPIYALRIVILLLYFAEVWLFIGVADDLTRIEKCQTFVQQTIGGLVLISPLLWMLRHNWP